MLLKNIFPELNEFTNADFDSLRIEKPALMIAMTARTGSTHLCSALKSVFGCAWVEEIFNPRGGIQRGAEHFGATTFEEYITRYSNESDAVYFKTNWIDFEPLAANIFRLFPLLKIIYLDRSDVYAQAISLYKADLTGNWHDGKDFKIEEKPVVLNLAAAYEALTNLTAEKAAWERYFEYRNMKPLRLFYEEFANDAGLFLTLSRIGAYLQRWRGVRFDQFSSEFKKLPSEQNKNWKNLLEAYSHSLQQLHEGNSVSSNSSV